MNVRPSQYTGNERGEGNGKKPAEESSINTSRTGAWTDCEHSGFGSSFDGNSEIGSIRNHPGRKNRVRHFDGIAGSFLFGSNDISHDNTEKERTYVPLVGTSSLACFVICNSVVLWRAISVCWRDRIPDYGRRKCGSTDSDTGEKGVKKEKIMKEL